MIGLVTKLLRDASKKKNKNKTTKTKLLLNLVDIPKINREENDEILLL